MLVITDQEGNVIESKTSDPGVRASIEKDHSKAKTLNETKVNAVLNKDLEAFK